MATIDSRYLSRGTRFSILDSVGYQPSSTIETNTPASLVLDFLDDKHVDDWSKVTFTRTSPATYFDKDGLLKSMGYNLILNSDDITQSSWLKTQAGTGLAPVVTLNAGVAPDGTMSATRLVLDKGAGTLTTDQSQISANGDSGMTAGLFSVWMKSNTASTYNVRIGNVGPRLCSVTTTWQQFTTTTSTETNARITLRGTMSTSDYADILVWHPQHETGVTVPSTYSSTTSVANSAARINYDPATPIGTTGAELVVNGDFSNGTTAWVGNNANIAIVSGAIQVTNTGAFGSARQTVTVTPGKTYRVSFSYRSVDGNNSAMYLRWISFEDGTGQYTTNTTNTSFTTVTVNLVAQSNTLYIRATANVTSGACVAEFDNISVQEVIFAPKGLLVEEQRTNLIPNSNGFNNNGALSSASFAQNAVDPAGTTTAWTITESATSANQYGLASNAGSATLTAAVHTASAFVKAGSNTRCQLCVSSSLSTDYANFLLTGSGSVTAATTSANCAIVALGGGWYRVSMMFTSSAATGSILVGHINTGTDIRIPVYLGTSRTLIAYGCQIELGSFSSSYIPTTSVTVQRSTDTPRIDGPRFTSWYNQSEGTFVYEGDKKVVAGYNGIGFMVSDNTTLNRLYNNGSATSIDIGGAGQSGSAAGTVVDGVVYKVGVSYASAYNNTVMNGLADPTPGTSAPPNVTQINLGASMSGAATTNINGHIRKITYYPVRLSDAVLKSMTKTDYEVVPSLVIDFTNNVYMS